MESAISLLARPRRGCRCGDPGIDVILGSTSKDLSFMASSNEVSMIEGVIQSYLDGLYESDAGKIASAFHPTSALTSVSNGELVITPRDTWLDNVRARPSPQQRGLVRHDRVLTIDLISPTMAHVKLNCAIPPRFFTDQLSLLKIDGRWQIVQKVFTTEMRD
jgi:Putative lumazine-binding